MRPFLFVDRDGTLIEERSYAHRIEDYAVLPGAYAGVRDARAAGFGVVIVTNQSGIGRGFFTREDYERLQAHLVEDFAEHGAVFDGSFVCPHAPDASCHCRKPEVGLIEQACLRFEIDLARSWVVGDKQIDVELARRSGCRGILVLSGQGTRSDVAAEVPVAKNLAERRK